ncbi:hypothetical protein Pmani_017437 [Petrolisthes manimaculis]|uniref:Zinc finger HIT domain-containing protein 3 n=1 Tax=Petrolisthes manimaculis TaxID=1843537 RepID=A0AAE1PPQ8_9EUCA|nr:hypothetical protein Pmani_017437 [Petrolisthes manimaculis]
MSDVQCEVCQDVVSKYKCPKCRLKYCSVGCYKDHQDKGCSNLPQETTVEMEVDVHGNIMSRSVLFPTDDTVMPSVLEKLRDSEHLCCLLKNRHLRELLLEVDKSQNTELIMQRVMKEPIFTEFADEILQIVEPSEDGGGSDMDEDV